MGTPRPNATETSRGTISGTRAMVHCDLPPLLLPLLLIIGPSNTQGVPGCYSLLCQLLVEQSQIPEVLAFSNEPPLPPPHKRGPGMEFVGEKSPWDGVPWKTRTRNGVPREEGAWDGVLGKKINESPVLPSQQPCFTRGAGARG